MDIRKTQQAVSISKVEENQRADVTKAKPISRNDTPDSFEIGGSSTSANQSGSSSSQEPEKKAGQITGGILIKQMTAARLGESGIRKTTEQQEAGGKRELGTDEQNRANGQDSRLEQSTDNHDDLVGSQTGNTGKAETGDNRSNRMERGAQLENFFANHGFDTSQGGGSSSDGASSNSGGGGGMSSDASSGSSPSGASDAINNAFNGPTGPGNPMDNFNERQAQRDALQNFASARSEMMDKLNPESGETASTGPNKDMISQGAGYGGFAGYDESEGVRDRGTGQTAKDYPSLERVVRETFINGGKNSPRAEVLNPTETSGGATGTTESKKAEDRYSFHENGAFTRFDANGNTGVSKNAKGEYEYYVKDDKGHWNVVSESEYKKQKAKADGASTSGTSGSSGTSSTSGASGTSTNYENYVDPKAKKLKQMSNVLSGMLGIETTVHKPRIAGDKDPDPNATPESRELSGIAVVSKEFLIGQPNQENQGGGPSTNGWGDDPILGGGAIDYEDRSGYHGGTRTEDPGDVNTAPGGSALKPAATDTTEEEDNDEEEKTNSSTKTSR